MGATQSQLQLHKQNHFERSISNIFNEAKILSLNGLSTIVDSVSFVTVNSTSQTGSVLICDDGSLHFFCNETLEILYSTKLRTSKFINIQKFGVDSLILVSDKNVIFVAKLNEDGFAVSEFNIEHPAFAVDINSNETFAVVDNTCNTFLCNTTDLSIRCLWKDISNNKPNSIVFGEINDEKFIAISADKLILGYIKEGEKPVFHDVEPSCIMRFFDDEIYCLSEPKKKLFVITLMSDLSIQFTETIYNGISICDVELVDDKTIVGCNLNNIFAYNDNLLNISLNLETSTNKIMKFNSRIFLVFCKNGTIIVCRVENQQNDIEYRILKNIHQSEIQTFCKVSDFSFLTVDINNHVVLWESLDDWWDAPFYSSSF